MKKASRLKKPSIGISQQQLQPLSQKAESRFSMHFDLINPEDFFNNQKNRITKQQAANLKQEYNQSIINAYKNNFNSSQSKEIDPFGGFFNQQSKCVSSADKLIKEKDIINYQKQLDFSYSLPKKVKIQQTVNIQDFYSQQIKRVFQSTQIQLELKKNQNKSSGLTKKLVFTKKSQQKIAFNKIFNFVLNPKNSQHLVYSRQHGTITPKFQCKFCKYKFKKSQALGGHVSKCPQKSSTIGKQEGHQFDQKDQLMQNILS